jgi:exodeoxyribonuclease-3
MLKWLAISDAEILGLQETRAERDECPATMRAPHGLAHCAWLAARSRRGYSGVALYSVDAPARVEYSLGIEDYDREGRFVVAEFPTFLVANVYFPKGSGIDRDNSRVFYKLGFTERVFLAMDELRRATGKGAVVMGDFNIAPDFIDLARPRGNETTSGFLPEERAAFARVLANGWVDTFRALNPDEIRYTWWSQRLGVRDRNIGWRIDHVLVSEDLLPLVRAAHNRDHERGSEH